MAFTLRYGRAGNVTEALPHFHAGGFGTSLFKLRGYARPKSKY